MRTFDTKLRFAFSCSAAVLLAAGALVGQTSSDTAAAATLHPDSSPGFVENRGQWPAHVLHRGAFGPLAAWVHADGWTLQAQWSNRSAGPTQDHAGLEPAAIPVAGVAIGMRFAGGAATARGVGHASPATRNYFIGADSSSWVTGVRDVAAVQLESLRPGIDAVLRRQDGHFEYDLVVAAGSDPAGAVIRCEGVEALRLELDGSLLLATAAGNFRQSPPIAWTEVGDTRRPVRCSVRLVDATSFRFEAPERTLEQRLVIDPGIVWATVVGTPLSDHGQGCRPGLDGAGNVHLGGLTVGTTFPTTLGAYQTTAFPGSQKAWLARFSPAGTLLWATYLSGTNGHERVRSLFVEPNGVVTAGGASSSTNFPQVNAFDPSYNGTGAFFWGDAWVARLDPAQSGVAQLTWSTYVGGTADDRLSTLHVAPNGVVTVGGWTYSTNIPGVSLGTAFQPLLGGVRDAFLACFDPSLHPAAQLLYFTYFGGANDDYLASTLVDGNGVITFDGATLSANLPTTATAFSTSLTGANDQYVARIDPSVPPAAQLVWSTYIGGTGDDFSGGDSVMDAAGVVTTAAWSSGSGFPVTPGAYDTSPNGGYDIVVYRLDPSQTGANQLSWSTYVGGIGDEGGNAIRLDANGGVVFVGTCSFGGLPTTATAQQPVFAGGGAAPADAYVARLDRTGSQLVYCSYLGGAAGVDYAYGLVFEPSGDVFVHGLTASSDFPTTGGTPQGQEDVFLTRLNLLPQSMSRFGTATTGCAGTPQSSAESNPVIGNASFGLSCIGAPPSAVGIVGWSGAALPSPAPVLGILLWIDPTAGFLLLTVVADANGRAFFALPLPGDPALIGTTLTNQFAFLQTCPLGLLTSSSGLSLTIQ